MALVLADRVQETSTSTGTGSFTLSGAVTGYQTFAVVGNGNTCYYTIADQGGSNWEVGIGTYSTTGPTLARTTVLSNSDGNTSPVDFPAGIKTVFITYPSEKSVNLDSSGNVSPLGTIASGTWQASTVAVAYGGTGVTSSSGANSVVLRDANANVTFNNFTSGAAAITAAGGTTVLTVSSARTQILVGSTTQTFQLPDATTLQLGQSFIFVNNSSGALTVIDNASTTVETVPSGGVTQLGAVSIATSAGSWGAYSFIPAAVNWGTNSLALASTVITGGTWQGGTIQSGYGGTGLTTFTGANNALYSTSSSALTAGTLPVPAGGTGQTSFPSGHIPYGNTTAALQSSSSLEFNGTYLIVGGTTPLGGATNPITAFSSTANNYVQTYVYNASTGTSASADFVAYSDNSTDSHGWADIGYTSSTYADAIYTITGPNEAYVFGSAPSGAGATGNLVYATDNTGSANAHQWYVGGFTQAKSAYKMQLDANKLELKTSLYVDGSAGTSGQVLTSTGSGSAPSWTTPVTGGGTVTTTDFTATSGQTVFTVNYTVGSTEVYQNGVKLGIADFTATNGTSITLATGATAGDIVEVVTFSVLNLYSTITYEDFSGTGSQTVFTMSSVPANSASLLVAISGVVQDPGTYTVSSTTLTFLTAPPSGSSNISVRYLGVASVGTVGSFSGGTTGLTPASATTGAVVLGGTLNVANGGTGVATSTGTGANVLSTSPTLATPVINGFTGDTSIVNIGSGQFYKDASGNLGIGTASPTNKITSVYSGSSTAVTDYVFIGGSDTYRMIGLSEDTANNAFAITNKYSSGGVITFRTGTGGTIAERMRIDSSGNVGIGTSSPVAIAGYTIETINNGTTGSGVYLQSAGTDRGRFLANSTAAYIGARNGLPLILESNATEAMRIDSSGNLLVGTTTASGKATIASTAQNTLAVEQTTFNYFPVSVHNKGTSGDNYFVLFGTEASLTARGTITYNRGAGLTAYNTSSDYRSKDILGTVDNAIAIVSDLKVHRAIMKGATQERPMFVAHELQENAPYAVTGEKDAEDKDGNPVYQQVDASALIPLLTKAIQEQQVIIKDLKARIETLEAK